MMCQSQNKESGARQPGGTSKTAASENWQPFALFPSMRKGDGESGSSSGGGSSGGSGTSTDVGM